MRQKRLWRLFARLSGVKSWIWKILFVGALIATMIVFRVVFRIKTVDCHFGSDSCPESINTILDNYRNKSIFLLKKKSLEADILSVGLSQSVVIKVVLPSTLIIDALPQTQNHQFQGIFSLESPELSFLTSTTSAEIIPPSIEIDKFLASQSGKSFFVTSNGTAMEKETATRNVVIAKSLPDRDSLVSIFHWLDSLETSTFKIRKIYFINNFIVLSSENYPDVVFQTLNNPQSSLKTLQALLSLSTISSTKVIDFRFNHPILR